MKVVHKISWAAGLLALVCVMFLVSAFASVEAAHARDLENGVYETPVKVLQESSDKASMCDQAIAGPATLTVRGSSASLQVELKPIAAFGMKGYLGVVGYLPGWEGGSSAAAAAAAKPAQVVSTFSGVKDAYNKSGSADSVVRGVEYPKAVAFPWDGSSNQLFLRVYIPIMNDIAAGNGWQLVRLTIDFAAMKRVGDVQDDGQIDDSDLLSAILAHRKPAPDIDPGFDPNPRSWPNPDDTSEKLDFSKLADGEYTVKGTVLKADRSAASMADSAVSHDVGLTVKGGRYSLTLNLGSVNVGGRAGYLRNLRYFKAGYSDRSGAPTGATDACKVAKYQLSGGNRVADAFGTDYPSCVTFPLIGKAKSDGLVPLQAFIPIMESIAAGTGTQAMYLKLDRSSVTSGKPAVSQASATGEIDRLGTSGGSVLAGSTLPSGASLLSQTKSALQDSAATGRSNTAAGVEAEGAVVSEERKPPLRDALVPMAVVFGAIAVAVAGSMLFRRRQWLLDRVAGRMS